MATGGYRISTESYRPAYVGSGRATVGIPHSPGVAGTFGEGIKSIVQAGNDWYDHVVAVGKVMSMAASKIDNKAAAQGMMQNSKEMTQAVQSY